MTLAPGGLWLSAPTLAVLVGLWVLSLLVAYMVGRDQLRKERGE